MTDGTRVRPCPPAGRPNAPRLLAAKDARCRSVRSSSSVMDSGEAGRFWLGRCKGGRSNSSSRLSDHGCNVLTVRTVPFALRRVRCSSSNYSTVSTRFYTFCCPPHTCSKASDVSSASLKIVCLPPISKCIFLRLTGVRLAARGYCLRSSSCI